MIRSKDLLFCTVIGSMGKKKTFMQNEQLIFKHIGYYNTKQISLNQTKSLFCKIERHRFKTNDHRCITNSNVLNKRQMAFKEVHVSEEIVPWREHRSRFLARTRGWVSRYMNWVNNYLIKENIGF